MEPTPTKVMSLRLAEELADEIAAVARVDGVTVSRAIREAVDRHISDRRASPEFQARLKRRLEADREILEQLAK